MAVESEPVNKSSEFHIESGSKDHKWRSSILDARSQLANTIEYAILTDYILLTLN